MKQIDVNGIAESLSKKTHEFYSDEIANHVNEKINGRVINQENLASEVLKAASEIIGIVRSQEREFTIMLLQEVIDQLDA